MRRTLSIVTAGVVAMVAAAGCKRGEESGAARTTDTAGGAVSMPAPSVQPPTTTTGAAPRRNEAQDHFDRSRDAFVAKDMTGAAAQLREGATFLRTRADSATGTVKEHLAAAARDLDRLAGDVDRKAVKTEKSLDYAFARANRAEAERHHAAAVDAWAKKETRRAGDELTFAADHLERAAKDAGEDLDAASKTAITETRTVADKLLQGVAAAPDEVSRATDRLGEAIKRVGTRIERLKG